MTVSQQAISKWMAKLKLFEDLKSRLQQSCRVATATLKTCTEEEVKILHQRAADFGFPVRQLKDAKDPEILKIVLAACAPASWLDDPELGCGNEISSQLTSLFLMCQSCLQAAIPNPTFVRCRSGFRVLCAFSVFSRQTGPLANRVDGTRDFHNSETTDLQAYLKLRTALKDLSHAIS